MRRWDEAARFYAGVAADGDSKWATEALYWLGITHERKGEAGKAVKAYERLVKEQKDNLGHTDEALKFYQIVLVQERPSEYRDHATAALLGLHAERGDLAKAQEMAGGLEGTASGPRGSTGRQGLVAFMGRMWRFWGNGQWDKAPKTQEPQGFAGLLGFVSSEWVIQRLPPPR